MDMTTLSVKDYHNAIEKGEITVKALVTYYLDRIKKYDKQLHAIICINDSVLEQAQILDDHYSEFGFKGILHGVPVLVKDNVNTKDMATTAGSKSLEGFIPDKNAKIIEKMCEAGALIIAKVNLHEFAIWGETISSILGQTYNPYDLTRTPGGSSGGTGASVAADFGMIGIGTDTINSIRSPASANCLVGIRPTVGLVSKEGVVPYSYTQDAIGPIARSVLDAAYFLEAVKKDYVDVDGQEIKTPNFTNHLLKDGLKGKTIGVLKDFFGHDQIHETTNQALKKAVEMMEVQGAKVVDVNDSIDSDQLVSEVSVHLYDLKDHLNEYLKSLNSNAPVHSFEEIMASGKYHPGIKENLIKASTLSTQSDEYKVRCEKRKEVQAFLFKLMDQYNLDALVYPHQKRLVCKVGGSQKERNGVLASVTGFPSICLPAGFSESDENAPIGVPIGMEILGRPFSEAKLIEIAYAFEQVAQIRKNPVLE